MTDKKTTADTIVSLFENEDLSEEFKTKAATIFEAAVSEAVERKLEEAKKELEEENKKAMAELEEALDVYLDEIASTWLEENELAIEDGIVKEMAESFLESIRDVMLEHSIDIDEEKIDIVEELETRNRELEAKLNHTINENIEIKKFIEEKAVEEVVEEFTSDMTESEKEKFLKLAENIEFETIDDLHGKLEIVAETLVESKKKEDKATYKGLNEEVIVKEEKKEVKKPEEDDPLLQQLKKYF